MEIDYRDENMKRIADALEEILRLVKADQEKYEEKKRHDVKQGKWSEEPKPDLPEDVPFKGRL